MLDYIDFEKLKNVFLFDPYDPLLFASSLFLILFIVLLILYRLVIKRADLRNYLLILFSIYFYYKASGNLIVVLFGLTVINYFFGNLISKSEEFSFKRILTISAVAINLLTLGYFKYTNFFINSYNSLTGGYIQPLEIIMPLGISFYIFKGLTYIFDNYYENIEPGNSFKDFFLYMFFFSNVLAGPIDKARDFLPQLNKDINISNNDIGKALLLICSGLIKKIVIADYISLNFVDRVFEVPLRFTGAENLIALYGYALQIYCDFSGYTDMAIGISLLLGIKLMDNFNSPYQATSVADFWRRWHISLSTWLLEYLFRPLQMSFRSMKIAGNITALLITFVLCGFWHGASWAFLFWGFLHGFYMSFSILTNGLRSKITSKLKLSNTFLLRFIQVFITFHLLVISWVFFRADSFEKAMDVFHQILFFFKPGVLPQFINEYTTIFALIVFGYVLHFTPKSWEEKLSNIIGNSSVLFQALLLAIVIWIAAQSKFADLQPFIYFQF